MYYKVSTYVKTTVKTTKRLNKKTFTYNEVKVTQWVRVETKKYHTKKDFLDFVRNWEDNVFELGELRLQARKYSVEKVYKGGK